MNLFVQFKGLVHQFPENPGKWGKLSQKLEKFEGNAFFWKSCLKNWENACISLWSRAKPGSFRLVLHIERYAFWQEVQKVLSVCCVTKFWLTKNFPWEKVVFKIIFFLCMNKKINNCSLNLLKNWQLKLTIWWPERRYTSSQSNTTLPVKCNTLLLRYLHETCHTCKLYLDKCFLLFKIF